MGVGNSPDVEDHYLKDKNLGLWGTDETDMVEEEEVELCTALQTLSHHPFNTESGRSSRKSYKRPTQTAILSVALCQSVTILPDGTQSIMFNQRVCLKQGWYAMTESQWKEVKVVAPGRKPFRETTLLLEKEDASMDPRYGLAFFEEVYDQEFKDLVKGKVKMEYNRQVKTAGSREDMSEEEDQRAGKELKGMGSDENGEEYGVLVDLPLHEDLEDSLHEIDQFSAVKLKKDRDPLKWWKLQQQVLSDFLMSKVYPYEPTRLNVSGNSFRDHDNEGMVNARCRETADMYWYCNTHILYGWERCKNHIYLEWCRKNTPAGKPIWNPLDRCTFTPEDVSDLVECEKELTRKEVKVYLGQLEAKREQAFINRVKYMAKMKENFDKHVDPVEFKVNDLVRVLDSTIRTQHSRKLEVRWLDCSKSFGKEETSMEKNQQMCILGFWKH
ncbi:hypothetical protein BT69DRAFT_1294538 [Atractiella rhizophila]|nr:hypothetical protein BT69DRAFT_1294538 [Atractiella rhizophila]